MNTPADFKIFNGFAYLFPDHLYFSAFPTAGKPEYPGKIFDWSRLYILFLVLFSGCIAYLIYFSADWGEYVVIPPLSIWFIWLIFRIWIRWSYTWTQVIEISSIQSIHYYKPWYFGFMKKENPENKGLLKSSAWRLFFRPSMVVDFHNHSQYLWKRRIRVPGWGIEGEKNLERARDILLAKYNSFGSS